MKRKVDMEAMRVAIFFVMTVISMAIMNSMPGSGFEHNMVSLWWFVSVIGLVVSWILKSPFRCPKFVYQFDVTGRRDVDIGDEVDRWLIENDMSAIDAYERTLAEWHEKCKVRVAKSRLKARRQRQYEEAIEEKPVRFQLVRQDVVYSTAYDKRHDEDVTRKRVSNKIVREYACTLDEIKGRYKKLTDIDFQCTLREWNIKMKREQQKRVVSNV